MRMIKDKLALKLLLVAMSCILLILCSQVWADKATSFTTQEKLSWDNAYNNSTKERFIPVELFTGAQSDTTKESSWIILSISKRSNCGVMGVC